MKNKSIKGQVLPFVAIIVLVLAMFVVVLVNIAQLEYSRQKAQIAADAGAITYMRSRAGLYNSCGVGNFSYAPVIGFGIAPGIFCHNKISLFGADITPYGSVIAPKSIDGVETFIEERLTVFGEALTGLVWANNGGPLWNAKCAVNANECSYGPLNVIGLLGNKSGLQTQDITLFTCNLKIVYVYGVPVPIPLPPYKKKKIGAYVCRKWSLDTRNAQPPQHMITVEATHPNSLWFGGLVGLPTPPSSRAIAAAQLYLDVSQDSKILGLFKHNGGFPRYQTDEGAAGYAIEPVSAYPKFNGVLVPVKVAGLQILH